MRPDAAHRAEPLPRSGAAARSVEIARMIRAGTAALILTPSAMPVSRPAYHASAVASRGPLAVARDGERESAEERGRLGEIRVREARGHDADAL